MFHRPVVSLLLISLFVAAATVSAATAAPSFKRPMYVNKVPELGLELRTEVLPRWETQLQRHNNGRAVFFAETPASTYPPAGMTWTVSGQKFSAEEFSVAAQGALSQAAANYGLSANERRQLRQRAATYGDLVGFESEFSAVAHGAPVDVKVFFGHQPGKPAVVMQAFTLRGKLSHISEQIRRSWTNTRYLKNRGTKTK